MWTSQAIAGEYDYAKKDAGSGRPAADVGTSALSRRHDSGHGLSRVIPSDSQVVLLKPLIHAWHTFRSFYSFTILSFGNIDNSINTSNINGPPIEVQVWMLVIRCIPRECLV